jgi:hypothetical protein
VGWFPWKALTLERTTYRTRSILLTAGGYQLKNGLTYEKGAREWLLLHEEVRATCKTYINRINTCPATFEVLVQVAIMISVFWDNMKMDKHSVFSNIVPHPFIRLREITSNVQFFAIIPVFL